MNGRTTPSQTVGPFFSIGFAWLERADLTTGASADKCVTICGRVMDGTAQPVPDALLEIWQADGTGRYALREETGARPEGHSFFGFGRVAVNEAGEFRLRTLRPGAGIGPDGAVCAPHLAISIFMRGLLKRLVTRMYFPGDPANETDAVLSRVPARRRHTLVARLAETGEPGLVWDVHLQGDQETVFFDC